MSDREQLYTALRNADAAGDTAAAQRLASYIKTLPADEPAPAVKAAPLTVDQLPQAATMYDPRTAPAPKSLPALYDGKTIKSNLAGLAVGSGIGAAGLGNTILQAATYPMSKVTDAARAVLPDGAKRFIPDISQWNRTRGADMESINEQVKGNMPVQAGKLITEVAGTWPVGGALSKGLGAIASLPKLAAAAPKIAPLIKAIETGGFKTGTDLAGASKVAKLADLGTRAAGGAITGGASAALASPDHIGAGALTGALLPVGLKGIGTAAGYSGKAVKSLAQPFTEAGQKDIAGSIIRKFADGGPMNINAAQLVPGSLPTLAEATGNAGIAGLQRGARDISPNAFVAREQGNAAARNTAFDNVAGDAGKLDYFRASRADAAKGLYGDALNVDASANMTPYLKGQVTQLLKRPSIDDASRTAQKWAIERGEKPYMAGSMAGLHDVKTALDDKIAAAVRDNQGGEAAALQATQAKLVDVMEKLSPAYKEARVTYAGMSQPVNEMEALQGLRLTDAKGNMTLSKVKNGIEGLQRAQAAPSFSPADSIQPGSMDALQSIHNDLLRQSNLDLGKSAGSNTFQNIATNNIVSSFLPGAVGDFVKGKAGGLLGQAGKLVYSGPNEAIRGQLVDMMLDPTLAQGALSGQQALTNQNALTRFLQSQAVQQPMYRVAPLLGSDL